SEIGRGLDQAWVRLADLRLPLRRIRLEVCPFIEGSKSSTFCCVGNHHEVIPWDVPASRCLNSNFETSLDDCRVYRTPEIQAFSYRPGGRQQFVNRGKVHGEVSSTSLGNHCVWQWILRQGYGNIVHARGRGHNRKEDLATRERDTGTGGTLVCRS